MLARSTLRRREQSGMLEHLASLEAVRAVVIRLDGAFEASQASRLEHALAAAVAVPLVFLDLTNTTWIDRQAMRTIRRFDVKLKRLGARLMLIGASGAVRHMFEGTSLYMLLDKNEAAKAQPLHEARATHSLTINAPLTF